MSTDRPTGRLDGFHVTDQGIDLIRSLKADGISIVLVEHVMSAVRALCDRCVVMSSGRKIAEGITADVLSDAAVVKAYLGGVAADA